MTTVYGVTVYGAQEQIRGKLKDIPDFNKDRIKEASQYLARLTFDSLDEKFASTKNIQVIWQQ